MGTVATLIEHLKSNIMEKISENPILFCCNLQANGHKILGHPADELHFF